jgi:hypothetical protein
MDAPLIFAKRSPSLHAVPVLAALVIGMTTSLLLTRPAALPAGSEVESNPRAEEGVAEPSCESATAPALDWTQTLAAPLLYLEASDYPSQRGPEAQHGAHTWLHDRGLRSLYLRAGHAYSLEWLEAQLGEPVFASGPHGQRLDFQSETSFGHYNPRFVSAAHDRFAELAATPGFVPVTRAPFQSHLQRQLETYVAAAEIVLETQTVTKGAITSAYQGHLRDRSLPSMFLQEAWRAHTEVLEARGADWYEANTALGFWTRRSIDGTAPQFERLMREVLEAYDLPSTLHEDFDEGGC